MTESSYASGSTATPPKLLDGDLNFGSSDLDGFGSMFDNVGKQKSETANDTMALGIRATESPVSYSRKILTGIKMKLMFVGEYISGWP